MRKLKFLVFFPLLAVLSGGAVRADTLSVPKMDPDKTVALFVSQRMFMEEALRMVTRRLWSKRYTVAVVAPDTGLITGMDQAVLRPNLALEDCKPDDFAALVIINGAGITTLWQDSLLLDRCREFAGAGRIVGAIGIAGICLADAGVLKDHEATILPDRRAVSRLLAGGARYKESPVVADRNVITAKGTDQAREFADMLMKMLDRRRAQQ